MKFPIALSAVVIYISVFSAPNFVEARTLDDVDEVEDKDNPTIELPDGTEVYAWNVLDVHLGEILIDKSEEDKDVAETTATIAGGGGESDGGGDGDEGDDEDADAEGVRRTARGFVAIDVNMKIDCDDCNEGCDWYDAACHVDKASCVAFGIPMEVYTEAVEAICENDPYQNDGSKLVRKAVKLLKQTKYFSQKDFDGVDFRFCGYLADFVGGMVPSNDKVLVHMDYYTKGDERELAVLMAHAVVHLRNYRKYGEEGFNCRYTKELVRGRGFGKRNKLEGEGYDMAKKARECIYGKKNCA